MAGTWAMVVTHVARLLTDGGGSVVVEVVVEVVVMVVVVEWSTQRETVG